MVCHGRGRLPRDHPGSFSLARTCPGWLLPAIMSRVVVLRHVAFEGAGSLLPVLTDRNHEVATVDVAAEPPSVAEMAEADLLVVMGGPIGVYEKDAYPFLAAEVEALRIRMESGRPTLGFCLGAQLMAASLGARVFPGHGKEIGWGPLHLTAAGRSGVLAPLDGMPVLHWHGDTYDLPAGAVHLARSDAYEQQAFAIDDHALAFQCHPEVRANDLEGWWVGHAVEIVSVPGVEVPRLREASARHAPPLERAFAQVMEKWLGQVGL